MSQLIGPMVQLSIGELLVLKDHGHCVGRTFHLRLEQLVETAIA